MGTFRELVPEGPLLPHRQVLQHAWPSEARLAHHVVHLPLPKDATSAVAAYPAQLCVTVAPATYVAPATMCAATAGGSVQQLPLQPPWLLGSAEYLDHPMQAVPQAVPVQLQQAPSPQPAGGPARQLSYVPPPPPQPARSLVPTMAVPFATAAAGGGGGTAPAAAVQIVQPVMPFGQLASLPVFASPPRLLGAEPGPTSPIPNTVPTVEGIERLHPLDVYHLIRGRGCLLVDLRDQDRSAGLIELSFNEPAYSLACPPFTSRLPRLVQQWADRELVIFTCQYSAHRAPSCANWYREATSPYQRVAIMEGGFRKWESSGLPVLNATSDHEESRRADAHALEVGNRFIAADVAIPANCGFGMIQAEVGSPSAAEVKRHQAFSPAWQPQTPEVLGTRAPASPQSRLPEWLQIPLSLS